MPNNNSAAQFLALRVTAVRNELSEAQATAKTPGHLLAVKALKKDLFTLECRLAAVL